MAVKKKVSGMTPSIAASEIAANTLFWLSRTNSMSMNITYSDLVARLREVL